MVDGRGFRTRARTASFAVALAACCGALPAGAAHAQSDTLSPFVSCATHHPAHDALTALFGYASDSLDTLTVPIGPANHFQPAPADRGQPSVFPPRGSGAAVRVVSPLPLVESVTWVLTGNTATASMDDESIPSCGMNWAGRWQDGSYYWLGEVVVHDDRTWLAVTSTVAEPGHSDAWLVLGESTPGPPGAQGPAGPPGPRGEQGPPGDRTTFPSRRTWRFSSSGRRRVKDPNVRRNSVIVIQYVGRGGSRPTSVLRARAGGFVATGSPNRSFRYVVFN